MELHKINKQIFWFCKMAFFAEVANVGWLKQRHKIKLWEQIFICLRNYFCSQYKDYWFLAWKHHHIIYFLKMKPSIILTNCCKLSFHTVCRNLTEELWFYVSRVIAKNVVGFMAWWTTIFREAGQNETKKIVIPNGLCQLFLLQCWNHAVLTSAIFGLRLWQKPPKTSPCFGPMASHLNWLLDLWIGLVWNLHSNQFSKLYCKVP